MVIDWSASRVPLSTRGPTKPCGKPIVLAFTRVGCGRRRIQAIAATVRQRRSSRHPPTRAEKSLRLAQETTSNNLPSSIRGALRPAQLVDRPIGLAAAVRTAVINKRAGGTGLISGRKAFQRPMRDGVHLLNSIQDVYLNDKVTIA